MSQSRQRFNSKIIKFFLFNSSWGLTEGSEQEKIVYHHITGNKQTDSDASSTAAGGESFESSRSELEEIVSDIGLCECVIKFVKNFGSNQEVDAVHGSKVRLVTKEVEDNFWIGLSLSVPRTITRTSLTKEDQLDEQLIEYNDEELSDYFVKLVINQIYETFYLLNGSLQDLLNGLSSVTTLRTRCAEFFDWFLPTIKVFSVNLVELFGAIQYLPLDNLTFMDSQSFINHVMCCDFNCEHSLFLYNEQLISSSLDLRNTRVVYRYLVSVIIPEAVSEEMGESFKSRSSKRTGFVKTGLKIHLVGLDSDLLMNVYRSMYGTTVAVLFRNTTESDYKAALAKCDLYMSSRLPDLAVKLAEASVRSTSQEQSSGPMSPDTLQADMFKFVYFNGSNAAFKSNSGFSGILDHKKISESEFVKLIIDLESDLKTNLSTERAANVVEIVAKTTNESWLVVHQSDARTLFSLLNHKNANIVEASEAVAFQISRQFKNILFID